LVEIHEVYLKNRRGFTKQITHLYVDTYTMKKYLYLQIILLFTAQLVGAQAIRHCGTHDRYLQAVANDPSLLNRRLQMEEQIQQWINEGQFQRNNRTGQVIITVPVVIHVLYQNATQNISDSQILSQLEVLNDDYGLRNADTTITPAAFKPLMSNVQIQFCLADTDPNGNPTTGIERRQVSINRIGNGNRYYNYNQGGLNAWNSSYYLNFWLCDIDGGSTLGYTYLPGTVNPNQDGIVVDPQYFGTLGTVTPPFNKGRTVTHEVGHWFNLEHIWADEPNCSADDYVADTPQQKGENYGCPSYPQTNQSGGRCNNTDPSSMYMNYMDYTDDACMVMFTHGQTARMQAALNTQRSLLFNSTGCSSSTGIKPINSSIYVNVVPNPSNGIFTFKLQDALTSIEIIITDIQGRTVVKKSFENNDLKEVNLSNESNGIYFARIITNAGSNVLRLVKN
jgi:hypothetical protein